jgi:hypothetical protein
MRGNFYIGAMLLFPGCSNTEVSITEKDDTGAGCDALVWYADSDGDGYGGDIAVAECEAPVGHVLEGGDCDDGAASVSPASQEICNGTDDDCDGETDEEAADADTWYTDGDQDGYGDPEDPLTACDQPSQRVGNSDDCDDGDELVNPDAQELCNGADDNCDGNVDGSAADAEAWFPDADGDGFGDASQPAYTCDSPEGHVADGQDCDDADPLVNPEALELCNGIDDDCNGSIDEEGAAEDVWYPDGDGDGYGDASQPLYACDAPAGHVADSQDCDDTDPTLTLTCDEPTYSANVCGSSAYSATGSNFSQPELHFLSAYQPMAGQSINVHIERQGQMTLLLSSYEPAHWIVTADAGVLLDQILVNGYHSQTISGPAGIPVEIRSHSQTLTNFGEWCGYSYPYNGGGCDTALLISGTEAHAGIGMTTFFGCYEASSFHLQ